MHNNFFCRICGLRLEDPPWGDDNKLALFDFCPCCGVEFGYQDATKEGARKFREKWLKKGARWMDERKKPQEWDLEGQLKQIPIEYK